MSAEIWLCAPGLGGNYEVSNYGRVKSAERTVANPLHGSVRLKSRILKATPNQDGYLNVYPMVRGERKSVRVHRLVAEAFIGCDDGLSVDHKDGNPSNNNLTNLRVCSHAENMRNQGVRISNKSGSTGVCFDLKSGKWRAYISCEGRPKHLGMFSSKDDAIKARADAAAKFYGEFARTLKDDK